MEKDFLCVCLNCNTVMIDENPQTDAVQNTIPDDVSNMEKLYYDKEEDEVIEEGFWGCPNCKTDSFLQDI